VVHTRLYASLPTLPGYTPYTRWSTCSLTYTGEATLLRDDDALGSKEEIPLGESLCADS